VETFNAEMLDVHAVLAVGCSLAPILVASEISATISSYLGSSNDEFDAMGDFPLAHTDQAERDHAVLKAAVRSRRHDHMGYASSARMGKLPFRLESGAPSAPPADVVYSIEPLIFFFNKLIQTTFVYLNAALRLATCVFELVVQPINLLRLFPSDVLGV